MVKQGMLMMQKLCLNDEWAVSYWSWLFVLLLTVHQGVAYCFGVWETVARLSAAGAQDTYVRFSRNMHTSRLARLIRVHGMVLSAIYYS